METIKEKFDNCIDHTNRVIYRWIKTQGIRVDQIYKFDVEAIFLGLIRKTIFQSNHIDFKRFSKCVNIHLNNGYLSAISTHNHEFQYFKHKGLIDELIKLCNETIVKFDIDQVPKTIELISSTQVYQTNLIDIDFKQLELIKF